jgi:hypothetical protein
VNKLAGHGWQGEKERAREMDKRVRDRVWLERVTALLVNLAVGQIPRSSMTDNPLEMKHHKQDDNYDKIRMLIF